MERPSRRRLERIHLNEPLPGKIGGERIFILDVSRYGIRIAHQHDLGIGRPVVIEFAWEGEAAKATGIVVRTKPHRVSRIPNARSTYHSGIELNGELPAALLAIIESHVMRALDEQKANARGIPPMAASSFQTGRGETFIRHEFIGGLWRQLPTTDPKQPKTGFTVASNLMDDEVNLLRESYETGDYSAREMLRKMAELSIGVAEGIPTRKYTP